MDRFIVSGQQTFVLTYGFALPPPINGLLGGGYGRQLCPQHVRQKDDGASVQFGDASFRRRGVTDVRRRGAAITSAAFQRMGCGSINSGRSYYVNVDGWAMSEKSPLGSQLRSARTPHVMIDYGTNVVIVPPLIAEHYHSTYPGAEKRQSPDGFVTWAVRCDSKPRLGLRFGNRTIYMEPGDLVFGDKREGLCWSNVVPAKKQHEDDPRSTILD